MVPSTSRAANNSSSYKLATCARKRKSRAKPKPMITQLLAHNEPNFRDLVQVYTGGPSSSPQRHESALPSSSAMEDGAFITGASRQSSYGDFQVKGKHCSHNVQSMQGWIFAYGSPANTPAVPSCVDDQGTHIQLVSSASIMQSIKLALKALSSLLVEPSSSLASSPLPMTIEGASLQKLLMVGDPQHLPPGSCEQLELLNVHHAASIIHAYLVKLVQYIEEAIIKT